MTPHEPTPTWPQPMFPASGRDALSLLTGSIPAGAFREYDLRGLVDAPFGYDASRLTPFSANVLGRAFGTYLLRDGVKSVVVGYDSRAYSPVLASALIEGLLSTGQRVVMLGLVTAPIVYYAQHRLGIPGAAVVTASHNPNGWAGFKLSAGPSSALVPDEIQALHVIADSREFARGSGTYIERSVTNDYIQELASLVPAGKEGASVAVDGANSIAGVVVAAALREAGHSVFSINLELDWSFPNHEPDPENVVARQQLADHVLAAEADLGIALDGDGDRLGLTDDRGRMVLSDRTLALLAMDHLDRHPGQTVVYDVKCSRLVADVVEQRGGRAVMWKTGHSHIKQKLLELGAGFAGERSGHFLDNVDYLGFDDAVYAALRVARIVGDRPGGLSSLIDELPLYHTTPTMHAACGDDVKYGVVERVAREGARELSPREVLRINGARFEFESGWFLVRASSNEPALVVVCESATRPGLSEMYAYARLLLDRCEEVSSRWNNDPFGPDREA